MASQSPEPHEVRLTPEDQMVLKYLVKLVMGGMSRDEIALAFDHAFVDAQERDVAALRALVQEKTVLPRLDEALKGGRFETLRLLFSDDGSLQAWRATDSQPA